VPLDFGGDCSVAKALALAELMVRFDVDDHELGPVVNEFVREHPWEQTFAEVRERIDRFGLREHCELMRTTSAAAAPQIADASVGLVHIDGNHDREAVEQDVRLYEPKLRRGGLLVLDDASWASVRPTLEELRKRLIPLLHLHDAVCLYDELGSDFAVFRLPE
jgi:hypothetical protein